MRRFYPFSIVTPMQSSPLIVRNNTNQTLIVRYPLSRNNLLLVENIIYKNIFIQGYNAFIQKNSK
jgi:hypothetical protein